MRSRHSTLSTDQSPALDASDRVNERARKATEEWRQDVGCVLFQPDNEATQRTLRTVWDGLNRVASRRGAGGESVGRRQQNWPPALMSMAQALNGAQIAHGTATLAVQIQERAQGACEFTRLQHRLLLQQAQAACREHGWDQDRLGGFVLQGTLFDAKATWALEDVLDHWPQVLNAPLAGEHGDAPLLVAARHLNVPAIEHLLQRGARWGRDATAAQALSGLPAHHANHPLLSQTHWASIPHGPENFLDALRTALGNPELWNALKKSGSGSELDGLWDLALGLELYREGSQTVGEDDWLQGEEDAAPEGLSEERHARTGSSSARAAKAGETVKTGKPGKVGKAQVERETLWAALYLTPVWEDLSRDEVSGVTRALTELGLEPSDREKEALLILALRLGRGASRLPDWPQALCGEGPLLTLLGCAQWEARPDSLEKAPSLRDMRPESWVDQEEEEEEEEEDGGGDDWDWTEPPIVSSGPRSLREALLSEAGGWNEAGQWMELRRTALLALDQPGSIAQRWVDMKLEQGLSIKSLSWIADPLLSFCEATRALLAGVSALERLLPEQEPLDRKALRNRLLDALARNTPGMPWENHAGAVGSAPSSAQGSTRRHRGGLNQDEAARERDALEMELAFEDWVKAKPGTMRGAGKTKTGPRRV